MRILETRDLHKVYGTGDTEVRALDGVNLSVENGEFVAIVGTSGSGKSTVARCIMNIYKPTAGKILYNGINVCDRREFRKHHKMLESIRQIIFQDSTSSLNQRMTVADIIAEPMSIHHIKPPRGSLRAEAEFQLSYVGMDASYLDKYPTELSGGQRQRVAIARALSMEPELLVADEPIASLDVSIQAQIINLLRHCNREHGCSMLFIAHDLSIVRFISDRIVVIYKGRIMEIAETEELFHYPLHPYTKALLSAVPIPDPEIEKKKKLLMTQLTHATRAKLKRRKKL